MSNSATRRLSRKSRAAVVRSACELSPLENRRLLSVSIGPDGYTTFGPSADSNIWYVSNSQGSDSNPGTIGLPFKTIAKAKSVMRNGMPDQMLLKKGDVWNELIGGWSKSGRSPTEMTLIGSYGTGARPLIRTNGSDFSGITMSGASGTQIRYVAIQGLEFIDNTHDGTESGHGIRMQHPGSHFYIEDVKISNFKDGITVGQEAPNPGVSNVTVRRSVIVDNWQKKSGGHSQGIYASGTTNGLLIEQNVFDHNGWKEGVSGAEKTVFNHNMYINEGAQGVVIRDNITTRASLRGILTRGGGVVTGNVTARNAIAIETWGDAVIDNNVVLENGDIPNYPMGSGIQVLENNGDASITNNIIAHDRSDYTYNVFGIKVWYGLNSVNVTDNVIYDWRRPFLYYDSGTSIDLNLYDNQLQTDDDFHGVFVHRGQVQNASQDFADNVYWSPRAKPFFYGGEYRTFAEYKVDARDNTSQFFRKNYLDPNRELGSYNAFLGGAGTFEAFIANARNMSRDTYNPNFTSEPVIAYIRQGFGLGAGVGTEVYVLASDSDAGEPAATGGAGEFTLYRTGSTAAALTFNYTIAGTATYGTDYTIGIPQSGQLTFPAGAASITIPFTPVADSVEEDPETVDFRISAGGGYDVGAPANQSINIQDGNGGTLPPDLPLPDPDDGGGWIPFPIDPIGSGTGLKGEYFENSTFSGNPLAIRLDPNVNYDYGAGAPTGIVTEPDTFSVRWTGYLISNITGDHLFRVSADDGVRVYVDDILVANTLGEVQYGGDANGDGIVNINDFAIVAANFNQSPREFAQGDFTGDGNVDINDFALLASRFNTSAPPPVNPFESGSVRLEASYRVDIRVEYVERNSNAHVQLFWTKPGEEEAVIPMSNLFPPDGFNGGTQGRQTPINVAASAPPKGDENMFSSTPISEELFESAEVVTA